MYNTLNVSLNILKFNQNYYNNYGCNVLTAILFEHVFIYI